MSNFHCPNCGGSDLHEHEHRIWNCYGCGDDWHEDSLGHEAVARALTAAREALAEAERENKRLGEECAAHCEIHLNENATLRAERDRLVEVVEGLRANYPRTTQFMESRAAARQAAAGDGGGEG